MIIRTNSRTPIPYAFAGSRETLHVAMAAIIKAKTEWWDLPETQAIGIGMHATGGRADPSIILDEFHAMRRERGL